MASTALLLGTRKGLITLRQKNGAWKTHNESFLGIPVSYAFCDRRSDTYWACLDHGHWGQKLQCSHDGSAWTEIDSPQYHESAMIKEDIPATLKYMWVLSAGSESEVDTLFMGTEPGGLFRSDDGGKSFRLVEGLWNHPSRGEHWFGGGRDNPGIHSVIVDPRDKQHMYVGISVAGVFETRDGGANWMPRN